MEKTYKMPVQRVDQTRGNSTVRGRGISKSKQTQAEPLGNIWI
jgi:hypothetical protein